MPTALARIQITETPAVKHALALAARRWPNAPKSEQLTRMIEMGVATIETERAERQRRRTAAVLASQGIFNYPPNYLAELRAEDRE